MFDYSGRLSELAYFSSIDHGNLVSGELADCQYNTRHKTIWICQYLAPNKLVVLLKQLSLCYLVLIVGLEIRMIFGKA